MHNYEKLALLALGLPKTIYFNFKYLKFKQAVKLPFWISHRVWLKKSKGTVSIPNKIKSGMIKIGFSDVGIFDQNRSRSIWEVEGLIKFDGKARIGHGSKLSISNTGTLELGNNFIITAESAIICFKHITFGENCLISWENLIMDTDFHKIKDSNSNIDNEPKPIIIGNSVWIGCRCLILKGTVISDGSVVSDGSIINKVFENHNQLIGGVPGKVLKNGISWEI